MANLSRRVHPLLSWLSIAVVSLLAVFSIIANYQMTISSYALASTSAAQVPSSAG